MNAPVAEGQRPMSDRPVSNRPAPAQPSAKTLLARLRRRAWLQATGWALAWGAFAGGLAAGLLTLRSLPATAQGAVDSGADPLIPGAGAAFLAAGSAVALAVLLVLRLRGAAWRVDRARLAAHLDRRFPELEESAALMLADPDSVSALDAPRRLQRARITDRWAVVAEAGDRWLPHLRPAPWIGLGLAGLALALLVPRLGAIAARGEAPVAPGVGPDAWVGPPRLVEVTVEPPAYTGLPAVRGEHLDISLPEGARVTWRFAVEKDETLRLVLAGPGEEDDRFLPLAPDGAGLGATEAVVSRSGLYHLERLGTTGWARLPGVHTLAVTLDLPPRLRVLEPTVTAIELPPDGPTVLEYEVRIEDDHGIGDVEIRASVAKGSGEGVKFRDEVFAFTERRSDDTGTVFQRRWSLPELGMAPGEEIYFFTVARDNRPTAPNEGRSDTVVVRWLDEAPPPELAAGLAIDVLPEYFKSQRQIIIETEQLIADRSALDADQFTATSRALGQDQGDLKGRYGQYLGDELDEGGSPFSAGTETAGEGDGDDADEHADEPGDHADPAHDEHLHEDPAIRPDTSGDLEALVRLFAHEHGTADIGPITRRNPVGLMKRSLANMWQAELHLRLADPETALPYEYEALKYLNLAREADRIYTRRLGFEPPPVTEERRLTGDLDEVRSRARRVDADPDPDTGALAAALYGLLTMSTPGQALDEAARDLLRRAADEFMRRSARRPALLRHAATLEAMAGAGRYTVPDCEDCLAELAAATWSLLPPVEPAPAAGRRSPLDAAGRDYLQALEEGATVP